MPTTRVSVPLLALLPAVFQQMSGSPPSAEPARRADPHRPLVFTHVTVIDATGAQPQSDMTLIALGKHISELGPTRTVPIPPGAQVVDGNGKHLIPGLWDMHWHSLSDEETRTFFFPLAIANGVTGVRDMAADCLKDCDDQVDIRAVTRWRKEIEAGTLLGPRLVVSSQIIDGAKPVQDIFLPVRDANQARQAVQTFKRRGVDFLKVYSLLSREAYFALADEAKRQGIHFAGHLPISVRASEASDAGQRSIEHSDLVFSLSRREAQIMREMTEEVERIKKQEPFSLLIYHMLDRSMIKAIDSYDSETAGEVVKRFVRNGTWFCPTLVLHRADAFQDDPEYRDDARLRYLPPSLRAFWAAVGPLRRLPPNGQAELKRVFPRYLQIVGAMRRAGANFLAGTDVTANNFLYPGFSVHDELALFVKAGFTPMEALQTATRNPAQYLGLSAVQGTIEKGKVADLVLLDANPLEDISNTRRIAAVVVGGRLLGTETLQRLVANREREAQ